MQLSQSASMRMEQRQLLTPRMIQSMEILQMPLGALEERIEQEMQVNPVLDIRQRDPDAPRERTPEAMPDREPVKALVVDDPSSNGAADFDRLNRMGDYLENEEFATNSGSAYRVRRHDGERDGKLDAMANSVARSSSLADHLLEQWSLVEATPAVKAAGEAIIDHIDPEGYLKTPFEDIQLASKLHPSIDDLTQALALVQKLDPPGIGARNLVECMLLQLSAMEDDEELAEGHDFPLERTLVRDHLEDLRLNRYPQLSKKLGRSIDELKRAVRRLARLQAHPGRAFSQDEAPPITPDAIIYYDEDTDRYEIKMSRDIAPSLYMRGMYRKMMKDRSVDKSTREFLGNNMRNAKWLIEAIEQRRSTIQRVIRVVVDAQREFFDNGPEFLRPLPMTQVADQLGIHVATVSRAVSEKWIQTPRGIYPLRRFFSGGTTSADGEDMSWDAVKEKLKQLVDNEDKQSPLSDEAIVHKLAEQGIKLARRTVAKYRDLLQIPTARQRREF